MGNTKNKSIRYPRDVAESQLTTKQTYLEYIAGIESQIKQYDTEIQNLKGTIAWSGNEYEITQWQNELNEKQAERDKLQGKLDRIHEKETELRRKEFDYNCGYSFLFDGIAALCTDYNDSIEILENNYYMARVRPETLEELCLGKYANDAEIKHTFWQEFTRVAKEPKTLVMNTDEGIFQGEPIRILVKRRDGKEGRKFSTIGNKGQDLTVLKNISGNPIDFIQLEFFTPMFRAVVDYQKNWIPLPRNLQAILYNTKFKRPELFTFQYKSQYEGNKQISLSIDTVRKYFLYVTAHNNNIGNQMFIDAIDFFRQVKPSELKDGKRLQNWYFSKQAMDALCYLHRELVNTHELEGIQFNTGNVYFEQNTKKFRIAVKREKPLEILDALPPQDNADIDENNYTFPDIPF